jgi:hypothetical protein
MRVVVALCAASLAFLTTGCATNRDGKKVLSERRYKAILATCRAAGGKYTPGKRLPPSVSVKSPAGEVVEAEQRDRSTPTVDCVSKALTGYRYQFLVLDDVRPGE